MYVLETQKLQDFKSASKNEHYCQIDSTAFSHAKRKKNFACGGLTGAMRQFPRIYGTFVKWSGNDIFMGVGW